MNLLCRENTSFMKGIALCLMFIHHLFAFPERIVEPNYYIPIISNFKLEEILGQIGQICVPIFLFLSGYGLSLNHDKNIDYFIKKIYSFYKDYWLVFFIFIPFGFYFLSGVNGYEFSIYEFTLNALALSSSYIGEAWFAGVYILLIMCTPIIQKLKNKQAILLVLSLSLLAIYFYFFVFLKVNIYFDIVKNFLLWQFIFIVGCFFSWNKDNYYLSILTKDINCYSYVFSIILFGLTLFLYDKLKIYGLIAITPFFIYSCLCLSFLLNHNIFKFVSYIGENTLLLWLVHGFFCYYYFQELTYYPKISIVVFFNLLLLSFSAAFFLMYIKNISYYFYNAIVRFIKNK